MDLTEIAVEGYEKVIRCHDAHSGLNAIISIHNTAHGPALGGMRMWPYATLHDALLDANRLAQGMTYKSAVAETGFGGGKAVILGHAQRDKSARLLRAMGRFVDTLGGQYITGEDVGTTVEDMSIVRQETPYVVGLSRAQGAGGIDLAGDIVNLLGPHHTRPILLRQPLCLGRYDIGHRQERPGLAQALAQMSGYVAAPLYRHAHAPQIVGMQRPLHTRAQAEKDAESSI